MGKAPAASSYLLRKLMNFIYLQEAESLRACRRLYHEPAANCVARLSQVSLSREPVNKLIRGTFREQRPLNNPQIPAARPYGDFRKQALKGENYNYLQFSGIELNFLSEIYNFASIVW